MVTGAYYKYYMFSNTWVSVAATGVPYADNRIVDVIVQWSIVDFGIFNLTSSTGTSCVSDAPYTNRDTGASVVLDGDELVVIIHLIIYIHLIKIQEHGLITIIIIVKVMELVVYNDTMYLFGGKAGSENVLYNEISTYNVQSNTFTTYNVTGTKPPAGHAMSIILDPAGYAYWISGVDGAGGTQFLRFNFSSSLFSYSSI